MTPAELPARPRGVRAYLGVFKYSGRAIQLVWQTNRKLAVTMGVLTTLSGLLPAVVAYLGKLIVDGVVLAATTGSEAHRWEPVYYVGALLGMTVLGNGLDRVLEVCRSLLRIQLGQRVNMMVLEKALTLELSDFEDSEFYDRMSRARGGASARPLSLVRRALGLYRNTVSLVSLAGLLFQFSGWAVLVIFVAAVPAFISETYFSNDAFRLFRWRAPETRRQRYYETLIAREDYAKEVQLFRTGPMLLNRYREIFDRLYSKDRSLTIRRASWGYALGLVRTFAYYGAYAWIVLETIATRITLGDMTMYLSVFQRSQTAVRSMLDAVGGMYEDNLYISTLYEYLEHQTKPPVGSATSGPAPEDGIRFEDVWFTYPGSRHPAVENVSLHISPGSKLAIVGENGAGKTTLIKLLTRLYTPTRGRILLDGLDLQEWDVATLRSRMGAIFQDFVRYQMLVGENIGVGDIDALDDEDRWERAAEKGFAHEFIQKLGNQYHTQVGHWFGGGTELSLGEWQKIALSRAFMRRDADILILDEPTASMDAQAEADVIESFREGADGRMTIVISHRFSTARRADQIAVMRGGEVTEYGSHDELMQQAGFYAHFFSLQARGYR